MSSLGLPCRCLDSADSEAREAFPTDCLDLIRGLTGVKGSRKTCSLDRVRAREPRGAYSADKWIFQKGGMFGSLCSAGGWAARILLNLDLLPRRQQTRRINRLWQRGGSGVGRGGFRVGGAGYQVGEVMWELLSGCV